MNMIKRYGKEFTTAVSLFLCVLFVLSSLMTSLAWFDFTQTKTNIFRGTADNVTVVLFLAEKDANGVISADPVRPIMNGEFQLYRIEDDGTETLIPGGPWYTDMNGQIIFDGRDENHPKLDSGKYVFVETKPPFGYTYDKDENDNNITRYEFEVTQEDALRDKTVTVPAYNRRGKGTLAVIKTVEGSAPNDAVFTFTVTFSDNGTYTYSIDGGEKVSIASGGTLTLGHGQTALFEDIPIGVQYRVAETAQPNYMISSSGHQGSITDAGSVAAFVNTYNPTENGSITVTKEVKGDGADADKIFEFTAVIGGETVTFLLKHGEEKVFSELPVGTEYRITETDYTDEGYIASVKEFTGVITGQNNVLLPFVNIYDPDPDGTGDLTIEKEVIGSGADPNKEFTFEITFAGDGAPQSPQTFKLKNGESKAFTGIPAGVTYTVRETDPLGYLPGFNIAAGVIASGETAAVTFRNHVPAETVKLSVTKKLAGEYPGGDADKDFSFTLIVNGEELPFTLKPNEVKDFQLPQGAQYEVLEADYFADGYDTAISNGFGTATDKEINVVVTNTFIADPVVDIEGEKTWELGDNTNVTLPEQITVRLKNGDTVVLEKVVKPDANGDWRYSFTAPKYDADGNEIVYTVEELPVDGFKTVYNGCDITNVYLTPVAWDPPAVTKHVAGEDTPATLFNFVLQGKNGAPMPEGSTGSMKTVSLTGSGQVAFGQITFTDPGVYTYTIVERINGAEGWTYDTASYTLTVTVVEEGGCLTVSEQKLEKDGEAVQAVEFTNTYTPPTAPNDPDDPTASTPPTDAPTTDAPTTDAPTTDGSSTDAPSGEATPTGDDSDLGLWFTLMILSLLGLIATVLFARRHYVYIGKFSKRSTRGR